MHCAFIAIVLAALAVALTTIAWAQIRAGLPTCWPADLPANRQQGRGSGTQARRRRPGGRHKKRRRRRLPHLIHPARLGHLGRRRTTDDTTISGQLVPGPMLLRPSPMADFPASQIRLDAAAPTDGSLRCSNLAAANLCMQV